MIGRPADVGDAVTADSAALVCNVTPSGGADDRDSVPHAARAIAEAIVATILLVVMRTTSQRLASKRLASDPGSSLLTAARPAETAFGRTRPKVSR